MTKYSTPSQTKYLDIPSKEDLILIFVLIVFSGNPYVTHRPYNDYLYLFLAIGLVLYSFTRNDKMFNKTFWLVAFFFLGILVIQAIDFYFFPVRTIAGYYVRLFIGFTIVYSIKNFPYAFVRVMFYITSAGILFHFIHLCSINIENILQTFANPYFSRGPGTQALFFHTYLPVAEWDRNAGMFWEPGAFAGYLNLSLVFLAIIKNKIHTAEYKKYLIVFIIAVLSTRSTMGYMVLPFSLFLNMGYDVAKEKISAVVSGRILLIIYIVLPILILTSTFVYYQTDFLKNKVVKQLQATEQRQDHWHKTRFGTLQFDWKYIKEKPLAGWGAHPKTRYALDSHMIEDLGGMGNGMSDFMAKYGIASFSLFLFCLYKGFKKNGLISFKAWLSILIIILTLQGEAFLNYPLYLGLFFLSSSSSKKIFRKIMW